MGRVVRSIGGAVSDVAGGVGRVAGEVAGAAGSAAGAAAKVGIQAISSGAASVAAGVGTLSSVGIAAAQSSFQVAALTAQVGMSVGTAAGIGVLGLVPPPGKFISQMAKADGQMGEILKQMQNPALNMQKQISQLQKGVEGALDFVMKAAANMVKEDIQRQTELLNRLNSALINFSQQSDELAAEMMKQLKA
jgi:hypothetical protein